MAEIAEKPLRQLSRAELRRINRVAWERAEQRKLLFFQRLRLKLMAQAQRAQTEAGHGD